MFKLLQQCNYVLTVTTLCGVPGVVADAIGVDGFEASLARFGVSASPSSTGGLLRTIIVGKA